VQCREERITGWGCGSWIFPLFHRAVKVPERRARDGVREEPPTVSVRCLRQRAALGHVLIDCHIVRVGNELIDSRDIRRIVILESSPLCFKGGNLILQRSNLVLITRNGCSNVMQREEKEAHAHQATVGGHRRARRCAARSVGRIKKISLSPYFLILGGK
jgi:hypothetical protein